MRTLKTQAGSVLINAILFMVLASIITFAMLTRAMSTQTANRYVAVEREANLFERSGRSVIVAAAHQSLSSGDWNNAVTQANNALSGLSFQEWTSGSVVSVGVPTNPYVKTVSLGPVEGFSPLNSTAAFDYGRVSTQTGTLRLIRTGSSPATRDVPFTARLLEVPSASFALVAAEAPLDITGSSTTLYLDGLALLNHGATADLPRSASSQVLGQGLAIGGSDSPVADWGASLASIATETPGLTGTQLAQNYPASIPGLASSSIIDWPDPATAPANLPQGITFQSVNGVNHVVVSLQYWFQDQGAYIRCTPATQAAGVVVVGYTGGGNGGSVIVATNGALTISGSNYRPVLLVSSYPSAPTVLSGAYTGTAGTAATSTDWTGFWFIPVKNLNFTAPENWSGATYTIHGGLVFSGGTIAGLKTLHLQSDKLVTAAFSQGGATGAAQSDRLVFPAVVVGQ